MFALSGCGGSTAPNLGSGSGPTPPAGTPVINSLSPNTVAADSVAFTLTATGSNFVSSTAIIFGNTTLTTTYVSSTELQAQVPASLITTPGPVSVIPLPESTLNFGSSFTITNQPLSGNNSYSVSRFPVEANDMVWDPVSAQLYLSITGSNPTDPNTVAALNPATGQLGTVESAGSGADQLAVSSDGSYLYAGIDSPGSVQQFTLPNLLPDVSFSIRSGTYGPSYAMDIEAAPGSPQMIAVVRGNKGYGPVELGGIVIYLDGVALSNTIPGFPSGPDIDPVVWNSNDADLYGIEGAGGLNVDFYVLSVNSGGVQFANTYQNMDGTISPYGQSLHFDSTTGYVYTDLGQVINPANGSLVATFPTSTVQGGFASIPVMVPDEALNIAYFLGETEEQAGTGNYVLEAYNMTSYQLIGAVPISGVIGSPVKLVRWGTNGLAFLAGNSPGAPIAGDGVSIISGGFVTSPAAQ